MKQATKGGEKKSDSSVVLTDSQRDYSLIRVKRILQKETGTVSHFGPSSIDPYSSSKYSVNNENINFNDDDESQDEVVRMTS